MRRLLVSLTAAVIALATAPVIHADNAPWFAGSVGAATQVISVVGVGDSSAKMDVWQKTAGGWQPIGIGIPARIGEKGMSERSVEGSMSTPKGIFSLDFVFGTAPSPGGALPYEQVGSDHWWDGDVDSPTYNTMQVCQKTPGAAGPATLKQCPFDTSQSENLPIPQYVHSVVMGVNKERVPGRGSAFFLHATDGGPTAGCVAIDDDTLVKIIRWLQPGALIAIAQ